MQSTSIFILILLFIVLAACKPPVEQEPVIIDSTPVPPAPTQTEPAALECNTALAHLDLSTPNRPVENNAKPVNTLAADEFFTGLEVK